MHLFKHFMPHGIKGPFQSRTTTLPWFSLSTSVLVVSNIGITQALLGWSYLTPIKVRLLIPELSCCACYWVLKTHSRFLLIVGWTLIGPWITGCCPLLEEYIIVMQAWFEQARSCFSLIFIFIRCVPDDTEQEYMFSYTVVAAHHLQMWLNPKMICILVIVVTLETPTHFCSRQPPDCNVGVQSNSVVRNVCLFQMSPRKLLT